MISRRNILVAAGGAALAAGCAPIAGRIRDKAPDSAFALPDRDAEPGHRLYHRAGFGPRPGDLQRYAEDGHEATVERLLAANEEEELALQMMIRRLDVFQLEPMDLRDVPQEEVIRQLSQAAVLRAVYGRNPLQERMVDFWTNHFNIYARKGLAAYRKGADEEKVIRAHALGSFPAMLKASAKSPAMLSYLDNRFNVSGAPNENYARELLELHTMGVNSGYTQKDIQEIARCFTGWGIERRILRERGAFQFHPDRHDTGEKRFLGHTIKAGGGVEDGEQVLDIVSLHPNTARYLARKLVVAFVGERDEALEKSVAEAYLAGKGEIRPMLRPILRSQRLMDGPAILKRPFDLVASSLRALDATTDGSGPIQHHLRQMGQPLYEWPMPDGFPIDAKSWTGSMLPRWNYAFALANGGIRGTSYEEREPESLFGMFLGRSGAPVLGLPGGAVAALVSMPAFQWR
jgi:uncharacterized protein (DUF1800 family)